MTPETAKRLVIIRRYGYYPNGIEPAVPVDKNVYSVYAYVYEMVRREVGFIEGGD